MTRRSDLPTVSQWNGAARLGQAWGVFAGALGDNAFHRHHAIQVVIGAHVRVQGPSGVDAVADGFVIPTDAWHRVFSCQGGVLLYVDPDAPGGRTIARQLDSSVRELDPEIIPHVAEIAADALIRGESAEPIRRLGQLLGASSVPRRAVEPRIVELLQKLSTSEPPFPDSREIAASMGLSGSRLVHVFTRNVGMPLRSYLLWMKLRRSMEAVARGASLTEAAHAGGFADSAHFSRTCRSMFGINPKALTGGMRFQR